MLIPKICSYLAQTGASALATITINLEKEQNVRLRCKILYYIAANNRYNLKERGRRQFKKYHNNHIA